MVPEREKEKQDTGVVAVMFSGGLDSAVLLAYAARQAAVQPLYVQAGLAWEAEERDMAARLFASEALGPDVYPPVTLRMDMRDVYSPSHWAVRGDAPAFDTPDADVYLEGRNIGLLAKASVFMVRNSISRVMMGPLAGNPFPDATPAFFTAMERTLSIGLAAPIRIETPFASMDKAAVIRLAIELGLPLELTLSCMQPASGLHCGRCSKCRERTDAFAAAGVKDVTRYQVARTAR